MNAGAVSGIITVNTGITPQCDRESSKDFTRMSPVNPPNYPWGSVLSLPPFVLKHRGGQESGQHHIVSVRAGI